MADTMDRLAQLEAKSYQLSAAIESLAKYRRNIESCEQSRAINTDADKELEKAKANILASVAGIKTLVAGPADFLQHLASQVQILACLQWLAEFQILACIPLEVSVPVKDLADLAGVPERHLVRVIRLTAAGGFLKEPKANLVAHTPLSAQFVTNESLLDAATFMAACAAPAALQMPSATHRFGATPNSSESAYTIATGTPKPFDAALERRSKLGSQWSAYLHHAAGLHMEEEIVDVLSQLNWSSLSNACIVEVGAHSTSMARCLVKRFPSLRVIVQIDRTQAPAMDMDRIWQSEFIGSRVRASEAQLDSESSSSSASIPSSLSSSASASSSASSSPRITVAHRAIGMPQPVTDADVYILHLPAALSRLPSGAAEGSIVRSQLQEYLAVLRNSGAVMLVMTIRLLPEPGSLPDPEVEAVARARDLTLLHLANEADMEMTELHSTIETVTDRAGKLVVNSGLRSSNGLVLALAIKYQAY